MQPNFTTPATNAGSKGFAHDRTTGSPEWYTPAWVFDALTDDQGARMVFDLDPCHPVERLAWIPARNVYSLPSDGLALPWEGRVWLNPPYGLETPRWLERLAKHGNGIALVFARPDTAWFHAAASSAGAVLFLKKRIRFVGTDGKPPLVTDKRTGRMREGSPGAGSMLIAWGADNVAALERSGLGILMTVKAGAA